MSAEAERRAKRDQNERAAGAVILFLIFIYVLVTIAGC